MIVQPHPLRRALIQCPRSPFLLFGAIARRGAEAGLGGDPVPQALVITGMVVSFSATALGIAILLRFFEETGEASLRDPTQSKANESDR
jgi:multicomponent Na+:H+ antiporter subunit C